MESPSLISFLIYLATSAYIIAVYFAGGRRRNDNSLSCIFMAISIFCIFNIFMPLNLAVWLAISCICWFVLIMRNRNG
jgi:hypothetical protein